MSGAWGTGSWGLGPFGAMATNISLVSALAIDTNTVQVKLSGEPLHQSVIGVGDATNPATWIVSTIDTSTIFTVISAEVLSDPTLVNVRILEPFLDFTVLHDVFSFTLRSVDGGVIVPPQDATFQGLLSFALSSEAQIASTKQFQSTDISNVTTVTDSFGGTLQIGSDGDYTSMFGADLVRKLIMRRLTTNTGEFFHLPNYGIGLPLKTPIPTSQLVKLKSDIESQVKLEPDVSNVKATVVLDPQGILFITIAATYSPSGQTFQVPIVIQPGAVQL